MNIVIEGTSVYRTITGENLLERVYLGEVNYTKVDIIDNSKIRYMVMTFDETTGEYKINTNATHTTIEGKDIPLVEGIAVLPFYPDPEPLTLEQVNHNVTETKDVVINTEGTVMMTSEDALTIMELQLENQALLNQIITKLGI